MNINNVQEPEYSSRQIKEFEKKYGFSSECFYEHYRQGESLIEDEYIASKWAFEYEVNRRAKAKPIEDKEDFIHEGGQSYGPSSFFKIYLMSWVIYGEARYIYKLYRNLFEYEYCY